MLDIRQRLLCDDVRTRIPSLTVLKPQIITQVSFPFYKVGITLLVTVSMVSCNQHRGFHM